MREKEKTKYKKSHLIASEKKKKKMSTKNTETSPTKREEKTKTVGNYSLGKQNPILLIN